MLVKEAVCAGARQSKACAILGISCRTLRRWHNAASLTDQRTCPKPRKYPHALSKAEKVAMIAICNSEEYKSLPPSQIVPRLADKGVYLASESSFYRVLREHNLQHHRGRSKAPQKPFTPVPLHANSPNRVWSWDITFLPSSIRGQFYRLYMVLDVYSRYIVGWEVYRSESSEHAAELIKKASIKQGINPEQLVLHSDNGSPMKGATMLATLQRLGIVPSFSRPSISDDNPYSESLFHTLKYTPAYPSKPFASIEQAQTWVHKFVRWYNSEHRHSAIRFVTPEQRHYGQDINLLEQRAQIYEQAKLKNPQRWKGRQTRDWEYKSSVWLNPPKEEQKESTKLKSVA